MIQGLVIWLVPVLREMARRLRMSLTPLDAVKEAEAVIVGIGSEFQADIKAVIMNNDIYKIYEKLKNEGNVDDDIYEYILHSIYLHEVESKKNTHMQKYVDAYNKLLSAIKEKNYFVLTTCTDDMIYHSDIEEEKIAAPCGSVTKLQYMCACDNDNGGIIAEKNILREIYKKLEDMKEQPDISKLTEVIPKCDKCHENLSFNIHGRKNYNENGYLMQWDKYTKWLQRTLNRKLVLLELGVDFSVPTVIRWPFEKIAMLNYKANLYRINEKLYQLPEEMKDKGLSISENSFEYINKNL